MDLDYFRAVPCYAKGVEDLDTRRLGRALRVLREAAGLEQLQLDRLSGISQSQISRLERGLVERPALTDLLALARALGVSLQQLTQQAGIETGAPSEDGSADLLSALMDDEEFAVEVVRLSAGYKEQTPQQRAFILDALRMFSRHYGTQRDAAPSQ